MITSKNDKNYKQCSISVMDNIADDNITFDNDGVSNYYYEYQKLVKEKLFKGKEGEEKLQQLISEIKSNKTKKYDCITGISGGVDSSYLIMKAKEWGLNPLIVHFDNGWNSEIAVYNINKIIEKTGFDLYTLVVNWEEFRDIQLSYIKASVVDIEVVTDHAISGTLQKLAYENGVKYILSGNNIVSEATLPQSWYYSKNDFINLKSIHQKFGKVKLKTYPLFGFKEQYYFGKLMQIETVKPLNFIDYNPIQAKQEIKEKIGWKDYGGKHHESVFTKFYQNHILFTKFHIDKRKAHLSDLIFSNIITKQEALTILQQPIYLPDELEIDKAFVLKKLGLTDDEFNQIMKKERVEHTSYLTQQEFTKKNILFKFNRTLRSIFK